MVASRSDNKSTNGRAASSPPGLARARRVVGAAGYLSPRLGARVAKRMWGTPRSYPVPPRELPHIASAAAIRLPLGTGTIAGWSWGQGPTILLVHGWEGRGSQLGAFAEPLVAKGFRVIAFDAPGHGANVSGESSIFSFADTILAVSRTFGPLHGIIAHSLGCAATLVALSGGLPVPRAVFIAPADASLAPPRFASMLGLSPRVQHHLFGSLERQYGATFDQVSLTRLAPRITSELLVIHDSDDRFAPLSDAHTLVAARPGTQLLVTQGLGHHRVVRDPKVVESAATFLDVESDVRRAWQPDAPSLSSADSQRAPCSFGLTDADIDHDLHYGVG